MIIIIITIIIITIIIIIIIIVCAFQSSEIKLLPNHQYFYGNLEYSVHGSASVVRSVFLFEKIGVYFYNY